MPALVACPLALAAAACLSLAAWNGNGGQGSAEPQSAQAAVLTHRIYVGADLGPLLHAAAASSRRSAWEGT
jgi:hypothetical protein